MTTLQRNRLKSSRNESSTEKSLQLARTPRVIGTSDGVNVDLPACAGYDRGYDLLIEEAVREQ